MEHKFWKYRNGTLIVQQYLGVVGHEDIIKNDTLAFSEIPKGATNIINLCDISQSTYPDLKHEQVVDLLKAVEDVPGLRMALYTGSVNYEDYEKAITYVTHWKGKPIAVVPFNFLNSAFDWLNLTTEEREVIKENFNLSS